jgi:hypothetical protein
MSQEQNSKPFTELDLPLFPEMLSPFDSIPHLREYLAKLLRMPMQDHPRVKQAVAMARDDLAWAERQRTTSKEKTKAA